MAVVSVELNNGEVVQMTTEVLAYLIRKKARMMRMDAEPDSWITLENGEHVPLDSSGKAIGGAGGWAEGKNFKSAKKATVKGLTKEVSSVLKPKYEYDLSLEEDDLDDFIKKNVGRRGEKGPANKVYDEARAKGESGSEAVRDEFYRARLQACTKDFKELTRDEADEILYDNLRQGTVDAWFREYNHEARDGLLWQMTRNPETHNAALNVMYQNYKQQCGIEHKEALPFDEFLVTPVKMYRGGNGKEHKTASIFSSYTFDLDAAKQFTGSDYGMGAQYDPNGKIYEGMIRPIDTYGSIFHNGESEILVPRGIAPNKNFDEAEWKTRLNGIDNHEEILKSLTEIKKRREARRCDEGSVFFVGELDHRKKPDKEVLYPSDEREDEEPASWITVNGNHIPLNEAGNPIGGQPKALGKKPKPEKKAATASRPTTAAQANKRIEQIVSGTKDNEKLIKDVTEVLRMSAEGSKIKMPESWADEDDGRVPVYEKNENGGWTDKKWDTSMSQEEMASYFAEGGENPDETPRVSKFIPNEKYIPSDDIKWKDNGNEKLSDEEYERRFEELLNTDDMYEARDRASGDLYDGQSQFFSSYLHGVYYGSESHDAFNSYNYYGDTLINGMLRGAEPNSEEKSKEWADNEERTRKYVDQMTKACDENPLHEAAVAFRGIKTPSALKKALGLSIPENANLSDLLDDHDFVKSLVGRTFSDPGFTSTSIDKDFPSKGGFDKTASMYIMMPKGTKGVYCGDALKITDEHEYILQRGTQFLITGAYTGHWTDYAGERHSQLHLNTVVIGQEPQEVPALKTYQGA